MSLLYSAVLNFRARHLRLIFTFVSLIRNGKELLVSLRYRYQRVQRREHKSLILLTHKYCRRRAGNRPDLESTS